jgi:hypothetical protein
MKVETWLFGAGSLFFAPIGVVYGILTSWEEPVGPVALLLTAGLSILIGIYLFITGRRIDPRPEDDWAAPIEAAAGEYGFFAPHSWWPLPLAASGAVVFLGLAIGWWLVIIGVGFGVIAIVGWVYEYSRGAFAH